MGEYPQLLHTVHDCTNALNSRSSIRSCSGFATAAATSLLPGGRPDAHWLVLADTRGLRQIAFH